VCCAYVAISELVPKFLICITISVLHNLMYKKVQQSLLYDMLLYCVNHVAVTCP